MSSSTFRLEILLLIVLKTLELMVASGMIFLFVDKGSVVMCNM